MRPSGTWLRFKNAEEVTTFLGVRFCKTCGFRILFGEAKTLHSNLCDDKPGFGCARQKRTAQQIACPIPDARRLDFKAKSASNIRDVLV